MAASEALEKIASSNLSSHSISLRRHSCTHKAEMKTLAQLAVSRNWGVLSVGVLIIRALLLGVYITALDFSETPKSSYHGPPYVCNYMLIYYH